jgi:hypothetical protein
MASSSTKLPLRPVMALAAAALTLALLVMQPPPASSLAPLGYSWSCASRSCSFYVTTTNHGAYQWNFGDGTITGVSTSTTASHNYTTPIDEQFHNANVALAGYSTPSAGSPDNIIGCQITYAASVVGIGTSGSCGP